jgi:glycosyltransferase involved in cell wall biosynthesis
MGDGSLPKFPTGVAYVLPGLAKGGAEKHVRDLAARLDRRKFSPRIVSTAGAGPMEEEFSRLGVPVHLLEYNGISLKPGKAAPLFRDAHAFFRRFDEILSANDVRIVHCYLPAANVLGMAAAKRSGTAVKIVSKRALCRYKEEHPVYSFFEDLANLSADAIMVNSRAVAEDVRRTERFLDGKIFLVYNGIEAGDEAPAGGPAPPPADLGLPADALPVTYVANIREDKAHLCLVEAAREVAAACPSVRFLLVGREGKEAEEVRRRIGESGLSDRVLLTGPRRDVPEILRASRLVAHPGEQEGFSNAILEAMAAGVPVVASNAGGNPEAVADGETGFLFPAGDAKALAASILRLLRDPARALAMGKAGRQRVREHFPVGKMVDEVERSYLELLEGRPLSCRL